jgi:eukaryotic-like serine/threonine-protein kinase
MYGSVGHALPQLSQWCTVTSPHRRPSSHRSLSQHDHMSLLDAAQWKVAAPHVDALLELTGSDRSGYVDRLRTTDPELASLLVALLASASDEQETLTLLRNARRAADTLQAAPPIAPGTRVGAYTVQRLIGEGGMGQVWSARRDDGRFVGTVAIKLLSRTLQRERPGTRFTREATALARLQHPNIARLLDAGVLDGDRPYLVLEYVDGLRIDHAADARGLGVRARVGLIVAMLDAVAHAHAQLVVHRDLKPSNVMLAADGTVKLLDFGIARLLDGDGATDAATTDVAMTPAFAAPEQARGEMITVATDVYAAGVLAYVLLSGHHPTAEGATTPADMVRRLLEGRIAAPSTLVDPPRARELRGDLDTILLRALALDPAARYSSAAAFADDLRRHLANEPVRARPDSLWYRGSRFVRRYRAGVAVAATAFVAVSAAALVALNQSREARRQRDAALREAEIGSAIAGFQDFMVSQVGEARVSQVELMERGRALLSKFGLPPAARARLLASLATRYYQNTRLPESDSLWLEADSIARSTGTPQPEVTLEGASLAAWGERFAQADSLLHRGRQEIASTAVRTPSLELTALFTAFEVHQASKRLDSASFYADRALTVAQSPGSADLGRATYAFANAASNARSNRQLRKSAQLYRSVVPMMEAVGLGPTMDAVISQANAAFLYQSIGEWATADSLILDARRKLGALDSSGVLPPPLLVTIANTKILLGQHAEGEALHSELARRGAQLNNPTLVRRGWLNVARSAALDGRPAVASRALAQAMAVVIPKVPNPRDSVAIAARIALANRDPVLARALLDRYFTETIKGSSLMDMDTVDVQLWRAEAYLALGEATRAQQIVTEALRRATIDSAATTRSALVASVLLMRARVEQALGHAAEACTALRAARAPLRIGYGVTHSLTTQTEATTSKQCGAP